MNKKSKIKFTPDLQLYNEPKSYREAEFYREALKYVLKNIGEDCVKKRRIEKTIKEIRRKFFK